MNRMEWRWQTRVRKSDEEPLRNLQIQGRDREAGSRDREAGSRGNGTMTKERRGFGDSALCKGQRWGWRERRVSFLSWENTGDSETWMSKKGMGLRGKRLSLSCLKFWRNFSIQASGLCWRVVSAGPEDSPHTELLKAVVGTADGWNHQAEKPSSSWTVNLWDHYTVFLTIQHRCFSVEALLPPWRALESRGDAFDCPSGWRVV